MQLEIDAHSVNNWEENRKHNAQEMSLNFNSIAPRKLEQYTHFQNRRDEIFQLDMNCVCVREFHFKTHSLEVCHRGISTLNQCWNH